MVSDARTTGEPRLAKLSPPSSAAIVARPRLLARLAAAFDAGRHVWIVAPAGSGKSSLVSSFCASRDAATLWYRIDEGDADPASFLHYLARALREQAGTRTERTWSDDAPAPTSGQRERLRALFRRLPARALVVLDDFHAVADVEPMQQLAAMLIEDAPRGTSLCFLSRSVPTGRLARHFAEGALIDRNDLLLSHDEALRVADARDIRDAALVEQAYALSEGWPTGFLLLLRASTQGVGRSVESLKSARLIADFFDVDVWPHVDDASRALLLRTAFVNVVTPAAAVRLAGNDDAPELLDEMVDRQLLVSRLQYGEGCVYHPLLRSFLQQKAARLVAPAELQAVKLESARLMEEHGDEAEVAGLLAAIAAWPELAAFIERNASRLIAQGRTATVEAWVRLLPADILDQSSWCRYWLGAALVGRDPTAAFAHFEATFRQMDQHGDASGASDACRAAMDALFWEGGSESERRPTAVSKSIASVLAMAQRVMPNVSGLHFGGFAMIASAPGHPLTRRLVEEAQGVYVSSQNTTLRVQAANLLVAWHIIRGDHRLAGSICDEAESLGWREDVPAPIRLLWLTGVAIYRWSIAGDNAGAIELIDRAHELLKRLDVPMAEHLLLCQRACAEVADGRLEAGARTLQSLRGISGPRRSFDRANELYVEAALLLRRGDAAGACMLFRSAVDQMGTTIFAVWTNAHRLALVQALLATDQPDEALREIRIVQAFARRGVSTHYHWMSQMGEADALLRLGRSRECDQVLAQALVLGRSKGLYSLPLAPDNALAPLLDRALTLGIENDYVRALAKRHRVRPTSTESDAWPWRIKVYVLGSFRLLIDDRPMTYGRKAQRRPLELLQAIVAHDGHDVPLATLAEALWPEADGDAADHALDVTALRLRRLLGEPPALQLANRRASLVDEHCWTDVGALKHALALLEPALHPTAPPLTDEALRVLHRCLALYRGPLLATETDAPWMLEARARYRMLIAHAFAAAARNLQTAGREADAQRLCTQLLERDAGTARWLPDWARRDGELTARTASARTAASYGRP